MACVLMVVFVAVSAPTAFATETSTTTASTTHSTQDEQQESTHEERERYSFANIGALSVVCDDETYLPNWGDGADHGHGGLVEPEDVTAFVAANYPHCDLAPDWYFEWANPLWPYPSDTIIGSAGAGWNPFGPTGGAGSADATVDVTDVDHLLVRVQSQSGFVPFAGETTSDDVSAEFYCADDIYHYDNLELIRDPAHDTTYFCVAFNAAPGNGDDDGDDDDAGDDSTGDDGDDSGGSDDPDDDGESGGDDGGGSDDGANDNDNDSAGASKPISGGRGGCLNCGGSSEDTTPGSGSSTSSDAVSGTSTDASGGAGGMIEADPTDPDVSVASALVAAPTMPVGAPDTGMRPDLAGVLASLLILFTLVGSTLTLWRSYYAPTHGSRG